MGPGSFCQAAHEALTTSKQLINPKFKESYGTVPERLTGHEWTRVDTSIPPPRNDTKTPADALRSQ